MLQILKIICGLTNIMTAVMMIVFSYAYLYYIYIYIYYILSFTRSAFEYDKVHKDATY